MANVTQKKVNWFNRFMIFLLAVVVAISLGLVIYYFLQDDETIGLKETRLMVNKGDVVTVSVVHENAKSETTFSWQYDNKVLEKNESESTDTTWKFTAISGGKTQVVITTNSTRDEFKTLTCSVSVGDGTQANPFYIKTAEDLKSIGAGNEGDIKFKSLSANYSQQASIDLSAETNWTPIGGDDGFSGTYYGGNFVIYNLSVNTSSENAGLFSKINAGATVSNLIFSKANISGNATNTGVVAGVNSGLISKIEVRESSVASSSEADNVSVGGIVGKMERTSASTKLDRVAFFENSSIGLKATLNGFAGGLAGQNISGTIINSFSRGTITTSGTYAVSGGICGQVSTNVTGEEITTSQKGNIINSYSTMVITADADSTKGAIVGKNINFDKTTAISNDKNSNRFVGVYYIYNTESRNIFWTSGVTTQDLVTEDNFTLVTALTLQQAKSQASFKTYNTTSTDGTNPSSWNFDKVWQITDANDGLPVLNMLGDAVADDIFDPQSAVDEEITSQVLLAQISKDLNGNYKIGSDFDIDKAWTEIGTEANAFNGILDGQGHTITVKTNDFQGLFGYLGANAQIINLNIVGVNIVSGDNVGIIAEYNNGLIDNCMVAGNITISGSANKNVGGIVGINGTTGQITNCKVGNNTSNPYSVKIQTTASEGKTYSVGGVAGQNLGRIGSTTVYGASSVEITNTVNGYAYAGGIAGQNAQSASIKNSTNMASVSVSTSGDRENNIAGGIVGLNNYRATIELCKVEGTTEKSATISGRLAGGLVGHNSAEDTNEFVSITKCEVASTTTVSGYEVGGLVGRMERGIMNNCATFANLSANTMAGFAVTVEGYTGNNGNGKYAIIDTCFSSATFDANAGTAYAETTSKIRVTNNYMACVFHGEDTSNPKSYKTAGYINNSKYNKANLEATGQSEKSYRQDTSEYIGSVFFGTYKDGATSLEDCKKVGTYDLSIWSTSIWTIVGTDGFPHIKF